MVSSQLKSLWSLDPRGTREKEGLISVVDRAMGNVASGNIINYYRHKQEWLHDAWEEFNTLLMISYWFVHSNMNTQKGTGCLLLLPLLEHKMVEMGNRDKHRVKPSRRLLPCTSWQLKGHDRTQKVVWQT